VREPEQTQRLLGNRSVEWLCGVDEHALPFVEGWSVSLTSLDLGFRMNSWYSDMHSFLTPSRYRTHPTTGMMMVALVASLCDEVRLYGFRDFEGPHHYYDPPPASPPARRAPPSPPSAWIQMAACPLLSAESPLGWIGVALGLLDDGSWWARLCLRARTGLRVQLLILSVETTRSYQVARLCL